MLFRAFWWGRHLLEKLFYGEGSGLEWISQLVALAFEFWENHIERENTCCRVSSHRLLEMHTRPPLTIPNQIYSLVNISLTFGVYFWFRSTKINKNVLFAVWLKFDVRLVTFCYHADWIRSWWYVCVYVLTMSRCQASCPSRGTSWGDPMYRINVAAVNPQPSSQGLSSAPRWAVRG
jgi:hypothetical protein